MSLTVEITEQALSRERQAVLSDLLVRTAGMAPEEAALTALVMPCAIGPMPSDEAQGALLAALREAGFAARAGAGEPEPEPAAPPPTYAPPAYAPPTYTQPPAYPAPAYPAPAYVPPAAPPYAAGPYAPTPAPASNNTAIIAIAAVLAVAVIALATVLLTRDSRPPEQAVVAPVTDAPPGYAGTDRGTGGSVTVPEPTMDGGAMDDGLMESEPMDEAPAAAPRPRSGGVQTARAANGQLTMTVSAGGRTFRLPRPLSPSTAVDGVQQTTLDGRDVVQFTARDGRWTTTYFWEYRAGLLHFVGEDGSTTNISEAPNSQAIIRAALGYVPGDDIVRGDGGASNPAPQRAPRPASRISTANVPNVIVMGSYAPNDQAGLQRRLALARQTGLTLQVVPAADYDMSGDYQVIIAGPFDYATTLRLLADVRRVVPDAFRKALD